MFWRKFKPYGSVFTFLFTVIFLAWFLFICRKVVDDIALQITGILSVLGLGFALFQFWFNHITTEKRRTFDLRYNAYKDVIQLVDTIAETLNEELTATKIIEVNGLLTKLTNQINKLGSTMIEYNYYLFPKIADTAESKRLAEITEKIIRRTDKYRGAVEKAIVMGNVENNNFLVTIEAVNWHNDILKYFKELYEIKYKFYSKLREYLN